MNSNTPSLLWLCGPSGVGKSTVGWRLYSNLTQAGTQVGYVDIDQLGMCYPVQAPDPDRHLVKARNLGAIVDGFLASGAEVIVVSGVVHEREGIRVYIDEIPAVRITLCRLHANREVLSERLAERNLGTAAVASAVDESEILDKSDFADVRIDTSEKSVAEVVRSVSDRTPEQEGQMGRRIQTASPETEDHNLDPSVLWLCGPTASGKSMIGWLCFEMIRQAGSTAAFVDLEQIGFRKPHDLSDPSAHRLKVANLDAMIRNFGLSGASHVVVVGHVDQESDAHIYKEKIPNLTLCRLHADSKTLRHRIGLRGKGGGPRLAGDNLIGASREAQDRIHAQAIISSQHLEQTGIGNIRVDTSDLSVDSAVQTVLNTQKKWLSAS